MFNRKINILLVIFSCFLSPLSVCATLIDRQSEVVEIVDENFDQVIEGEEYILVDFYADWCGPCKRFLPIFAEVSNEYEGEVVFAKINIEQGKNTRDNFNVRIIPTLILFKNGKELARRQGSCTADVLREFLSEHIR